MKVWIVIGILLAMLVGIMHGMNLTAAGKTDAFIGPNPGVIPAKALRLRIIANSNSPFDQNLKRTIRDTVINVVGERMAKVTTLAQAKQVLQSMVPEVESIALAVERKHRVFYGAKTSFGQTAFPTKLYGDRVYAAGNYEALKVVLGKGAGQNWWCVLFPPLCFVALSDGDAVAATKAFPDFPPLAVTSIDEPGTNKRVPVALRLAVVDYGEQFVKMAGSELGKVWRQISLSV